MKKSFIFLFSVILLLTLAGCGSAERKGVPEEVVLSAIDEDLHWLSNISDSVSHKISHDVNSNTHIDTVSVILNGDSQFGTTTNSLCLQYQYDRSSDLWTLLNYEDISVTFSPSEKGFSGYWEVTDYGTEYGVRIFEIKDGQVLLEAYNKSEGDIFPKLWLEGETDPFGNFSVHTGIGLLSFAVGGLYLDYFADFTFVSN